MQAIFDLAVRRPLGARARTLTLAGLTLVAGMGISSAASAGKQSPNGAASQVTTTTVAPAPSTTAAPAPSTTTAPSTVAPSTTVAPPTTTVKKAPPTTVASAKSAVTEPSLESLSSDPGSLFAVTQAIHAQDLWSTGVTGAGVDIAIIDTGVAPVPGLAGKIINGPDLSLDVPFTSIRSVDAFGHGTHLASIAAGVDPGTRSLDDRTKFVGVAPGSRIVNVRVGSFDGAVDVSQVIAGIDWVVQHRNDNGMNIRVINLAYGTQSTLPYWDDPLSWAVETAWRKGIVVVAAAGNAGTASAVTMPAVNPRIIAAGAVDQTLSTPTVFTSSAGLRKPDLFAPGAHILGLRVPGSFVDSRFPNARVGSRLVRGTGTSQATAVIAGAAALLVSKFPAASPDQIRSALIFSGTDVSGNNYGNFIQLDKAVAKLNEWGPAKSIENNLILGGPFGTGSLEAARGGQHLVANGIPLTGEIDIMGKPWNGKAWSAATWNGASWTGGSWNGSSWTGASWTGLNWAGASWTGASWTGASWTSIAFAGASWTGASWTGASWTGASWTGASWTGASWTGASWTGASWTGASWLGAFWG